MTFDDDLNRIEDKLDTTIRSLAGIELKLHKLQADVDNASTARRVEAIDDDASCPYSDADLDILNEIMEHKDKIYVSGHDYSSDGQVTLIVHHVDHGEPTRWDCEYWRRVAESILGCKVCLSVFFS